MRKFESRKQWKDDATSMISRLNKTVEVVLTIRLADRASLLVR